LITDILARSEVDLGVRWKSGRFLRTGARSLDNQLVNDPLHWLTDPKLETVRTPYAKGLEHYLRAIRDPQVLPDVVTDMYEALEALAKIVTGRDKDLSANRESFIRAVGASDQYKILLKDYIAYANTFRHGAGEDKPKPALSAGEVESFIYLTGIFIRLAMQASSQTSAS
jgi:hypothetical protein